MSDAKVTSKGQITIPKMVRERLHLEPGDHVTFDVLDDGSVVMKPRNLPWERLVGMLRPNGKTTVTVAGMEPGRTAPYHPGGLK